MPNDQTATLTRFGVVALFALALGGCASLANRATERVAGNLSSAMLNQDDPATVREGLPAYLLLLDGLIEGSPESAGLLLSGARLNSAFAGGFVTDKLRAQRLSRRAMNYAKRAVCARGLALCDHIEGGFEPFQLALQQTTPDDVADLHILGSTWTTWVQAHRDDWNAIADLPKIEALFEHLVSLDEAHAGGEAHMFLGVLYCLRPESLGGRPQLGRQQFERATAISGGRNLMAATLYAEYFARLVFDRELHDRLLQEVVAAEPRAHGLTLSNTLAQQRAAELLASADDYF